MCLRTMFFWKRLQPEVERGVDCLRCQTTTTDLFVPFKKGDRHPCRSYGMLRMCLLKRDACCQVVPQAAASELRSR